MSDYRRWILYRTVQVVTACQALCGVLYHWSGECTCTPASGWQSVPTSGSTLRNPALSSSAAGTLTSSSTSPGLSAPQWATSPPTPLPLWWTLQPDFFYILSCIFHCWNVIKSAYTQHLRHVSFGLLPCTTKGNTSYLIENTRCVNSRSFKTCKSWCGASMDETCLSRCSIGLRSGESGVQVNRQPRDVEENMIHQTRPPSSIAWWPNSDAHVLIVCIFGNGKGSAWAPWLVCGDPAPHPTTATVARLLNQTMQAILCSPSAWALVAHDPVAGSPLFRPWTTFDRYWPLQTRNTP